MLSRHIARIAMLPLLSAPVALAAQQAPAARFDPSSSCDYRRCAYNIVPVLHGLTVVRGEEETPVATLGFLWTRDITDAFAEPARDAARRAVRTRRVAAVFTDLGLALAAAGVAVGLAEEFDETAGLLIAGGVVSITVSVPLQFRADKYLAQATWIHNARYAR